MDNDFSQSMRLLAREHGLCDAWFNAWGDNCNIDDLLDKFTRGFDFYIEKRWLTPSFIKENAGVINLRQHGIICNDSYSLNNLQQCFLIGESQANLRYNGSAFGTVWMLDNSTAEQTAKGRSEVYVHLYDRATLKANLCDEHCKIVVFMHSSEATLVRHPKVEVDVKYAKDYK